MRQVSGGEEGVAIHPASPTIIISPNTLQRCVLVSRHTLLCFERHTARHILNAAGMWCGVVCVCVCVCVR